MNLNYTSLNKCCERFQKILKEDTVLTILDYIPYVGTKTKPLAYLQSDGGHGGLEDIDFCPFCGKKLEF